MYFFCVNIYHYHYHYTIHMHLKHKKQISKLLFSSFYISQKYLMILSMKTITMIISEVTHTCLLSSRFHAHPCPPTTHGFKLI